MRAASSQCSSRRESSALSEVGHTVAFSESRRTSQGGSSTTIPGKPFDAVPSPFSGRGPAWVSSRLDHPLALPSSRAGRRSRNSLPAMPIYPGVYCTSTIPYSSTSRWNVTKASCEESDGVPFRHRITAVLSTHTVIHEGAGIALASSTAFVRAWRAPSASASKTSARLSLPKPSASLTRPGK